MDNTVPHVHTFYEILWFREAGGTHTLDFHQYEVKKNTLLFISPGQVHFFDNPMGCKGVILRFCTDIISGGNRTEDMFIKYGMFNTYDGEPCFTVDEPTASILDSIVDKMRKEQEPPEAFGHTDMMLAYVQIFIIHINRYGLQSVDHKLNVSTKTLSNSVIECTGKTPLTFINDRLILEAKRLLHYSNMSGKEVGYYLGFEDPSYFVKFFKRMTGQLPSEYQ